MDINKLFDSVPPLWGVTQEAYSPEDEGDWETRFCLANGYAGVRGSLSLATGRRVPAAYFAGVFDKPDTPDTSGVFGLTLRNKAITPSFAIAPCWNLLEIEVAGEPVDFLNCRPVAFRRTLDLRRGLLLQEYSLRDRHGRTTRVREASLLSVARRRLWMSFIELEALDYEADAVVRAAMDLQTTPGYLPRLRDYTSRTDLVQAGVEDGMALLRARVSETGTEIAAASRVFAESPADFEIRQTGVAERLPVTLRPGAPIRMKRMVSLGTGRDGMDPAALAKVGLAEAEREGSEAIFEAHCRGYASLWEQADVAFEGDDRTLLGVRLCIFNLLSMANPDDPDVSISATGLHGQGYFGHVFWDTEIFMLPFYLATNPRAADSLLRYRAGRLDAARANARAAGCAGAKYPWTSTAQGYDVTPPDWQRCADRQIHISADVAFAFSNHRRWTGDWEFFRDHGIEVIVETAKLYLSKVTHGDDGKYHLLDVLGPDEYHLHANDNFYTNHIVRWNFTAAVAAMDELAAREPGCYATLASRTGWDSGLRSRLLDAANGMAFPRIRDGVCEQYTGFFDLPDIGELRRGAYNLPQTPEHFYDTETQVSKQADVPMLHYLFGEDFQQEVVRASYDYYDRRCSQASSLSPSVFAVVGLQAGREEHAYGYFQLTALLDLENLHMDRNLPQGIHAACAGGTWCAAIFGFGGVSVRGDTLSIDPRLPSRWSSMRFPLRFRGRSLRVEATRDAFTVRLTGAPLELFLGRERRLVSEGVPVTVRRG